MIEAVNSVLSNLSSLRASAEQQSVARSFAANPEKKQEVAKAPYVSPYISLDNAAQKAVLQIRDSDTGDVIRQYPTEGQLKAYRAAQEVSARVEHAKESSTQNDAPSISAPSEGGQAASVPDVPKANTHAEANTHVKADA